MKTSMPQLNTWRSKIRRVFAKNREPLVGFTCAHWNPADALAATPALRLVPGWRLLAAQYYTGADGNAAIVAIPDDAVAEALEWIASLESLSDLWETLPPRAAPHFMAALAGDGSAAAYAQASMFRREVPETGAYWHGGDWGCHEIVSVAPWISDASKREVWEFEIEPPASLVPELVEEGGQVRVDFYTHSDLGKECLYRHEDIYPGGSLVAESSMEIVATGPGGKLF